MLGTQKLPGCSLCKDRLACLLRPLCHLRGLIFPNSKQLLVRFQRKRGCICTRRSGVLYP